MSTAVTLPRLMVSPRTLVVQPSTTVALTCALHPADPADAALVALSDVRWKRDGRELDRGRGHVTLVIADFDETSHAGVYRCSAEMAGVGRAVSDHATLRAAGSRCVTIATSIPSVAITYYTVNHKKRDILFFDYNFG